jgi:dihydrofolate reductase
MSKISIIAAASKDMVIGKDNKLPWHLPTDLKNFKRITEDSFVIMGRKCWESIPDKFRPLPERDNIIISRDPYYEPVGATVINDLETIIRVFKNDGEVGEVFIIGGAQIYKEAFKHADKLYLTQIFNEVEGDTYLEGLDFNEWVLTETSEHLIENDIEFRFTTFEKLSNVTRKKKNREGSDS